MIFKELAPLMTSILVKGCLGVWVYFHQALFIPYLPKIELHCTIETSKWYWEIAVH